MTATHDKEWKVIEDKHNGIVYSEGNDEIGWKFCYVDKTLLDQIRRDAVAEYKDNIYQLCRLLNITEKEKQILDKFLPVILRAKTLGGTK